MSFTNHKSQITNHKTGFIQAPVFSKSGAGFTLIELLIVFTIIAVLSALIFGNLYVIPRMRDGQRKADLRQIQHALEQYKADQDLYPVEGFWPGCGLTLGFGSKIYLSKFPCDPNGSGYWNSGAYYTWSSDPPRTYKIGACLENTNDTSTEITTVNPGGTGTCTSGKYYVLETP